MISTLRFKRLLCERFTRCFKTYAARDDGSSTIEFSIIFPLFMFILMGGYEVGYYTVSSATLDRGLDMAVRDVRLGRMQTVDIATLKSTVCDYSSYVRDCEENIHIALEPVNADDFVAPKSYAQCKDRKAKVEPATVFKDGAENELMLVRACVLVDPIFPTTWLGAHLQRSEGSGYAMVSTAGFVNEPNT
ncbi:TadE-like protein [Pacificibacter maritimus]|uniref:TadE-like protein n=1 Tax=Pacificibacter maritimus TaxID=762213 RepID=A0A3N4UWS3_9RHOB|nr:TadE family protein [Pacificibacter maritimus]RPE72011.1 TadE-like protein [Pacificibacter maritimus]